MYLFSLFNLKLLYVVYCVNLHCSYVTGCVL